MRRAARRIVFPRCQKTPIEKDKRASIMYSLARIAAAAARNGAWTSTAANSAPAFRVLHTGAGASAQAEPSAEASHVLQFGVRGPGQETITKVVNYTGKGRDGVRKHGVVWHMPTWRGGLWLPRNCILCEQNKKKLPLTNNNTCVIKYACCVQASTASPLMSQCSWAARTQVHEDHALGAACHPAAPDARLWAKASLPSNHALPALFAAPNPVEYLLASLVGCIQVGFSEVSPALCAWH